MTDTATGVPIPSSDNIAATNPFEDGGASMKSPGTPQAGQFHPNPAELMSPPPSAPSPGYPMNAQSPNMPPMSQGYPVRPGMGGPGMGGPGWPQGMHNPMAGYRPNPGMPQMHPGMRGMMPGQMPGMREMQMNMARGNMPPGFMNNMPPGMFTRQPFPNGDLPQNGIPPASVPQQHNPADMGQMPSTSPNRMKTEPDEINEILSLFPERHAAATTSPVSNEPSKCGKCKSDIFPKTDVEELVRCFSCKTWFKRNCVGISELAYKQLVLEQAYVAWSCQSCIENKVVNSMVPKSLDNNNCTNRPIPPEALVHAVAKPEKRERKSRKGSQKGKAKVATAAAPSAPQLRPPMGIDPRFRMMNPHMMRMMGPDQMRPGMNPAMMMNRHINPHQLMMMRGQMPDGMMPPGMGHPGMPPRPGMPSMSGPGPSQMDPNDPRFPPPSMTGFPPSSQPMGMNRPPFDQMGQMGLPPASNPSSMPDYMSITNHLPDGDDPLAEITGLDPLPDTKPDDSTSDYSKSMDFNAIMSSMNDGPDPTQSPKTDPLGDMKHPSPKMELDDLKTQAEPKTESVPESS